MLFRPELVLCGHNWFFRLLKERESSRVHCITRKEIKIFWGKTNGLNRSSGFMVLSLGACIVTLFFLLSWTRCYIYMNCALRCISYIFLLVISGTLEVLKDVKIINEPVERGYPALISPLIGLYTCTFNSASQSKKVHQSRCCHMIMLIFLCMTFILG